MNKSDKRFILCIVLMVSFFASALVYKAMGNEEKYNINGWIGTLMMIIVFFNIWYTKEKNNV